MHNGSMSLEYRTVTPYMIFRNADKAVEYYKQAFDAVEKMSQKDDYGRIVHAELMIGDSLVMISEATERFPELRSIEDMSGSAVQIFFYREGVDAIVAKAVAAGGELRYPVDDKPYGRSGGVVDPFGLIWWVTSPPSN